MLWSFKAEFGQNRANSGVIIGVWVMKGAQYFRSGIKGSKVDLGTLINELCGASVVIDKGEIG